MGSGTRTPAALRDAGEGAARHCGNGPSTVVVAPTVPVAMTQNPRVPYLEYVRKMSAFAARRRRSCSLRSRPSVGAGSCRRHRRSAAAAGHDVQSPSYDIKLGVDQPACAGRRSKIPPTRFAAPCSKPPPVRQCRRDFLLADRETSTGCEASTKSTGRRAPARPEFHGEGFTAQGSDRRNRRSGISRQPYRQACASRSLCPGQTRGVAVGRSRPGTRPA